MTLGFAAPLYLLLVPVALWPLLCRDRTGYEVSTLAPMRTTRPTWRTRLDRWRRVPPAAAILTACLLLSAPEWRQTVNHSLREGVEIMLVMDTSASMRATDMSPDRISVAREVAADFLLRRRDDRVGVMLFSGQPYLLSPTTTDRRHVAKLVRGIEADETGAGTALGDALVAGTDRLQHAEAASRIMILLTDGSSNRGSFSPRIAAQRARREGIRIYTIGFGTPEGGDVPLVTADGRPLVGRDRLEVDALQQIAELTGGGFFRARDAASLASIYRRIDRLEKSPMDTVTTVAAVSLAPLLTWLLAGLLVIELLVYRCVLRRLP